MSDHAFYKNKNVLVAGAAGMTGQSLVRKLLEQGAFVRATRYKNRTLRIEHKNLEIFQCDLNTDESKNAMSDIDVVFNCAGKITGAKVITENPSRDVIYNLHLWSRLMDHAVKAKVDRFCFVSSSYVYPHTGKPNVEEEGFQGDPWFPMNYGLGWIKRYIETLCKFLHMETKTNFSIVRPTAIYGPYDNFDLDTCHVIPALIKRAVSCTGQFEIWGDGSDVRSFTYVDDLSEGLMTVTDKYAVADPINICPFHYHTVAEAAQIILRCVNKNPKVIFDKTKPSVIPYKVSHPMKAKELLRFTCSTEFEVGIRKTVDWFKEYFDCA